MDSVLTNLQTKLNQAALKTKHAHVKQELIAGANDEFDLTLWEEELPTQNSDDTVPDESMPWLPATPESPPLNRGFDPQRLSTATDLPTVPQTRGTGCQHPQKRLETEVAQGQLNTLTNANTSPVLYRPDLTDSLSMSDDTSGKQQTITSAEASTLVPIINAGTELISFILERIIKSGQNPELSSDPNFLEKIGSFASSLGCLPDAESASLLNLVHGDPHGDPHDSTPAAPLERAVSKKWQSPEEISRLFLKTPTADRMSAPWDLDSLTLNSDGSTLQTQTLHIQNPSCNRALDHTNVEMPDSRSVYTQTASHSGDLAGTGSIDPRQLCAAAPITMNISQTAPNDSTAFTANLDNFQLRLPNAQTVDKNRCIGVFKRATKVHHRKPRSNHEQNLEYLYN